MVLASPGPLLTLPPSSSPPNPPILCPTPPNLHPAIGTRPRPRQAPAAAAGGDGSLESRTGPRPTQTRCDTPATAPLCRVRQLTTLKPTKRQPATTGAVERAGESRRQGERRPGHPQVAAPHPHTHAGAALRQLTMHVSTNDLHYCIKRY